MMISLVVCTRNRAAQLRAGLKSLAALHAPFEWQLVIVDNASTDETPSVIEEFRSRFSQSFRSVTETTPGTGAARDRGWRTATGEIVAYIDDDCYPAEDYLTSMAGVFRENPEVGVVAGRILLFDPTDYEITVRTETVSEEYASGVFIDAGLFQTANCAFRRVALEAVGGFDARFGPGAEFVCEDADVVARISAAGWRARYDPRPLVRHHHGRKSKLEADRLMEIYDRGRGAYYAKCLLNPRLRSVYARNWYWKIRRQSLRTTRRELIAASEYFARSLLVK